MLELLDAVITLIYQPKKPLWFYVRMWIFLSIAAVLILLDR